MIGLFMLPEARARVSLVVTGIAVKVARVVLLDDVLVELVLAPRQVRALLARDPVIKGITKDNVMKVSTCHERYHTR